VSSFAIARPSDGAPRTIFVFRHAAARMQQRGTPPSMIERVLHHCRRLRPQ